MIRNEAEYQEASARLADERQRLAEHRARLKEAGLGEEEIKRVIDPMESFHLQLKEEVESYERLKRGEFEELENFGITLERAVKVLDALNVRLHTKVEMEPPRAMAIA